MKRKLSYLVLLIISLIIVSSCFYACDKTASEDKQTISMYYDETSSFGLFFYGEDQTLYNDDILRAKDAVNDTSYFDPSKPTIIWIHGWQITGSHGDLALSTSSDAINAGAPNVNYALLYKEAGYNVATFQYQLEVGCDVGSNLFKIYSSTFVDIEEMGYSMAYLFASELCMNIPNYEGEITYIGHSCGGFVSVGVNYYVQKFLKAGTITNKHLLASKMILADPYFTTLLDDIVGQKIYLSNEVVTLDKTTTLCNMVTSLHQDGVKTQIYLAMKGASGSILKVDENCYLNLSENCAIIDMEGLRNTYTGSAGKEVHLIARDWALRSILADKIYDQNGNLAPSGALSSTEAELVCGKQYKQTNTKLSFVGEVFEEVGTLYEGQ